MARQVMHAAIALLVSISTGYSKTDDQPHLSAEPLKVTVSDPWLIGMKEGMFDVRVLVKCTDYRYTDKRREDRWFIYGCRTDFEVLKVEQGTISASRLVYFSAVRWPTPESGIMISLAEPFFLTGGFYHLDIDLSTPVPLIVSARKRSPIPPHGLRRKVFANHDDPNTDALRKSIQDAGFSLAGAGSNVVIDMTDDSYVVEHSTYRSTTFVLIDKKTFKARWLESPQVCQQPFLLYDDDSMEDALKWLGLKPEWFKDEMRILPEKGVLADKGQRAFARKLLDLHCSKNAAAYRELILPECLSVLGGEPKVDDRSELGYKLWQLEKGNFITSHLFASKFIAVVEPMEPKPAKEGGRIHEHARYRLTFYHYDDRFLRLVCDESFAIVQEGESYVIAPQRPY